MNKKNKRKTQVSLCIQSTKIAEKIQQTKTKVDLSVFKLQELQKQLRKRRKETQELQRQIGKKWRGDSSVRATWRGEGKALTIQCLGAGEIWVGCKQISCYWSNIDNLWHFRFVNNYAALGPYTPGTNSTSPSLCMFHFSAINFLGTKALLFCCMAKLNLIFWGVKGFFVCGHGC